MTLRGIAAIAAAALVAGVSPLAAVQAAEEVERSPRHRPITVMTQNLYLGSPLTPALAPEVDTPEEFVAAVATIYAAALATDFPARAEAIADTIAQERPGLVGLQEVVEWGSAPTHLGPTPVSQDFLAILLRALQARGLDYEVAGVSHNADIGPVPLVAPALGCGADATDCVVSLRDRDVVLVDDDARGLSWWGTRTGRYEAQQTFTPPGSMPVSFARGWVTVEASYRGQRLRFANTHLEVAGFPQVQQAQAREFLAGPARTRRALVAVGDFNSAADGSTTGSYRILTADLHDAWAVNPTDPGHTSGRDGTLSDPTSQLTRRIDLILTRSSCGTRLRSLAAHLVNDEPFQTETPVWPSDHAGVVSRVELKRGPKAPRVRG